MDHCIQTAKSCNIQHLTEVSENIYVFVFTSNIVFNAINIYLKHFIVV